MNDNLNFGSFAIVFQMLEPMQDVLQAINEFQVINFVSINCLKVFFYIFDG